MSANYTKTSYASVVSTNNWFSLAKNRACLLLFLLGVLVATVPAGAQPRSALLYVLNQGSTYEEGCFPPCACPEMIQGPVQGTFLLTPTGSDGLFYTYNVKEVNWTVTLKDKTILVTGSGTYKVGGEIALQQELTLDLQMSEGGTVEHFDSGLVSVSAPPSLPFPDIKVAISINGQVCLDQVFDLSTSPARRAH